MTGSELLAELVGFRAQIVSEAAAVMELWEIDASNARLSNLAVYLALRHRDLRPLQRELMWRGLSSLGRLEGRVLPAIDAAITALASLLGSQTPVVPPTEAEFFGGERRLAGMSEALLGHPPEGRATRIMVTLPSEAATDAELVAGYARAGMNIARINCAHDDAAAWQAMARNVRAAAERAGNPIRILADVAGPKIRTGGVSPPQGSRLSVGDSFGLSARNAPPPDRLPWTVVSAPQVLDDLKVGERVFYNDGKAEGVVRRVERGRAWVEVTRARAGGFRLKPEKGLNFPDSTIGLPPLTSKDRTDLETVLEFADIIGYSFVSRPEDIDLLEAVLQKAGNQSIGLIVKIERPEAISNLPALIARARPGRPFGVMIARGDLAVEIGFERLAEMQEEILWICEAAAVPTIWATQVLEGLVAEGTPSRGEMTDAAMAARAECVMLNKGPMLSMAIEVLARILGRMDDNVSKKTSLLRALGSW